MNFSFEIGLINVFALKSCYFYIRKNHNVILSVIYTVLLKLAFLAISCP